MLKKFREKLIQKETALTLLAFSTAATGAYLIKNRKGKFNYTLPLDIQNRVLTKKEADSRQSLIQDIHYYLEIQLQAKYYSAKCRIEFIYKA